MKDFFYSILVLFFITILIIGACFWGGYLFTDFPSDFKSVFVYKTITLSSKTGKDVIFSVVMIVLVLFAIISIPITILKDISGK